MKCDTIIYVRSTCWPWTCCDADNQDGRSDQGLKCPDTISLADPLSLENLLILMGVLVAALAWHRCARINLIVILLVNPSREQQKVGILSAV